MFRFLLVAIIPALVLGQQTNVELCTGGGPSPLQVRVFGCINPPCDIFQGTEHAMDVDFVTPNLATALHPVVYATALGVTINYPLDERFRQACNYLEQTTCPLQAGDFATYNFAFPVPPNYPPIPVAVELTLRDHLERTVFCTLVRIHVRIP